MNAPTEDNDIQMRSRVDKLEKAFQSVIETSHPQTPSIKAHTQTDQVSHRQNTSEIWNSRCLYGRWNTKATNLTPTFKSMNLVNRRINPIAPAFILLPEINSINHGPVEDADVVHHLPTWQGEDWQTQSSRSHQSQVYPIQNQYHSHPQQNFELPLDRNWHTNSIEERIKGLIVSQHDMRRCLKSNDELTLEMHNAYGEQKISMDEMIKQVSLLAYMMKGIQGIQEDRERSLADEQRVDEEGVHEPKEGEPSNTEYGRCHRKGRKS